MSTIKSIFDQKFNNLNEKRKAEGKSILTYGDLAIVIFANDKKSNSNTKRQKLSERLSGKYLFNSYNLRVMRKIFTCTIDELFPVSQDIEMEINL